MFAARWLVHYIEQNKKGLRHSAGSFLFALEVPTKVISEVLGYSATRITEEVYIHVQAKAERDVAQAMERILWK